MRKLAFSICENKGADQLHGKPCSCSVPLFFATKMVQSLFFLNPKFQASSHLLGLYRLVCAGPGLKIMTWLVGY